MPLAPIMPASAINVRVTNRCPLARQTREQLARLSIAKHLHSRLCPPEPADNLAWECSGRELRGRKMKFDSRYWHKRAIEMRSIANETKNPQSKETMLGIAHDY